MSIRRKTCVGVFFTILLVNMTCTRRAVYREQRQTMQQQDSKEENASGCISSPCKNSGTCEDNVAPVEGQDYYCRCAKGFAGLHCNIVNPCKTCPSGYAHCITTSTDRNTSRYCFAPEWDPMPTPRS